MASETKNREQIMKFGLLYHKSTTNLGDDIQTYAIEQFLPHVDYMLDREHLDEFRSDHNEPVAAVMAAWWMYYKWNWPPATCICPQLISMHLNNYGVWKNSSPITNEWLKTGPGREYLMANGPVGCRDTTSVEFLKKNGIDAYFSGCVTLTLPKQRRTLDRGKYVVIADLRENLKVKVKEWLKDSGLEIREVTHRTDKESSLSKSWKKRSREAKKLLTLYQNARFVVTRRLHVTLPCLAMGVPVISIVNMNNIDGNAARWAPYLDWTYYISEEDVKNGNIHYNYNQPPENSTAYLDTRNSLICSIKDFVKKMDAIDGPLDEVRKTTYSETQLLEFRNNLRRQCCELWLPESVSMNREYDELGEKLQKSQERIGRQEEKIRELKKAAVEKQRNDSAQIVS